MISALSNAFFFFLMMWIKELQAHPMKLFMLAIACDSILLSLYVIMLNTCSLGLHKLLAWTIFFDTDCTSYIKSVNALMSSGAAWMAFVSVFAGSLQLCICVDLILTINSPF